MLATTHILCYIMVIAIEKQQRIYKIYKEVFDMSSYCEVCGKGTSTGMNISHSHVKTKRTWQPNIHKIRAKVDGEIKRLNVCTRCIRSGKVDRTL